jgi:hypothetical protein
MSEGGKITDSQKRQRVPSLSEMGAALQQAEVEVTGLKADLAKARAASARWLELQTENGKQAQEIKGLEAEKDALKKAKVRGVRFEGFTFCA